MYPVSPNSLITWNPVSESEFYNRHPMLISEVGKNNGRYCQILGRADE